jgi:hypothetical protein
MESLEVRTEWSSYLADPLRVQLYNLYTQLHQTEQDIALLSRAKIQKNVLILEGEDDQQKQVNLVVNGQEVTATNRDEIQKELLKTVTENQTKIILKAINFWSSPHSIVKYKHLHKKGLQYLLATATTCGVERVFSIVTRMEKDTTARCLMEEGFQLSVFMQSHQGLVEEHTKNIASKVPSLHRPSKIMRTFWKKSNSESDDEFDE